jgi:hypothetical protein
VHRERQSGQYGIFVYARFYEKRTFNAGTTGYFHPIVAFHAANAQMRMQAQHFNFAVTRPAGLGKKGQTRAGELAWR